MALVGLSEAREQTIYLSLLTLQTTAATFMLWVVFPLFRRIIVRLGEPQEVSLRAEVAIIVGTLVLQSAYWARHRWITVRAPFYSAFVGHVVQFASRISFLFGGALFSSIFFRHIPELDAYPTIEQAAARGLIIMWALFALFCFSLELEQLGRAMGGTPKPQSTAE